MDLAKGDIGPEAHYDVVFADAKLKAELKYAGAMGGAGLYVEVGVEQVVEAIKKAIPGQIDDAVLDVLKVALLAAK